MTSKLPFPLAFAFIFLCAPLALQAQSAQGEAVRVGATVQGQSTQLKFTDGPTAEDQLLFEAARKRRAEIKKGPLPPTPIGPEVQLQTDLQPPASFNSGNSASLAAEDISVAWNRTPIGVIPAGFSSTTGEPSVAQNGGNIFMTGNWYGARSTDSGSNWAFVSPFTTFPASDGGFCCDQEAVYDPVNDMYIWLTQYIQDGTDNRFRIAVTIGDTEFSNGNVYYWDFLPSDVGWATNRWFDYPHISINESTLTLTTNVFDTTTNCNGGGCFQGTTIMWYPLSDMADKGGLGVTYFTPSSGGTMTPVQGTNDTIYWGQHVNTSSLRLFRLEGGSVFSNDITHSSYVNSGYNCAGPDGNNACGRTGDRIQAGWVSMGVIGFAWNAAQGSGANWPWVKVVRIRESDRTLFDERSMQFNNTGVAWPSAAVNDRGHIGGTVVLSGGTFNPSVVVWMSDHYNAGSVDNNQMLFESPRDYTFIQSGTNGPASNRWGDYYRTRRHHPGGLNFIGTGVILSGGTGNANTQPRLFKFGREEDNLDIIAQKGVVYASLAGPYLSGGSSSTGINSLIPLKHPFSGSPWNFTRQDFVFQMPSDVVDWVLLSAYTPSGILAGRQAALLKDDGEVVWPNGETNLTFSGTLGGVGYYLGLDHRNHLEVVSDDINTSTMTHSFRLNDAYGTGALIASGDGYDLLRAGDGNVDYSVTAFDFLDIWLPENGSVGTYSNADFNMDATISAFDFLNAWLPSNGTASQYPWD